MHVHTVGCFICQRVAKCQCLSGEREERERIMCISMTCVCARARARACNQAWVSGWPQRPYFTVWAPRSCVWARHSFCVCMLCALKRRADACRGTVFVWSTASLQANWVTQEVSPLSIDMQIGWLAHTTHCMDDLTHLLERMQAIHHRLLICT